MTDLKDNVKKLVAQTNGLTTALVEMTGKQQRAEGVIQGAAEEKAKVEKPS